MTKASRVALPKTYHQVAPRGTGCCMIRRVTPTRPVRSSIHASTLPRTLIHVILLCAARCTTLVLADRQRACPNFDLIVDDAHRVAVQRVGRRSRRDLAGGVVGAAVT